MKWFRGIHRSPTPPSLRPEPTNRSTMKKMTEFGILITFVDGSEPLTKEPGLHRAESLCIEAARRCHIGPAGRHLFALRSSKLQVWLNADKEFIVGSNEVLELQFLVRFRPVIAKLQKEDLPAFNYYFYQVRRDFLNGVIPEAKHKEDALGLAVTDMLRFKKEEGVTIDDVIRDFKSYLPEGVSRKHNYGGFLSPLIRKALLEHLIKLDADFSDTDFIKGEYIQGIRDVSQSYGCEEYNATWLDGSASGLDVRVQIDPFHPEQPGIRILRPGKKQLWQSICTIEELCYVSIRNNYNVLEISRRIGVPQYLSFKGKEVIQSFVSAIDGYYRLMEKWTFNLCKDMPTPSLIELRKKKCHGPVDWPFAQKKLLEKRNNKPGCYLLREGHNYGSYLLDLCIEGEDDPQTFTILRDQISERYHLEDEDDMFETIQDLIAHYKTHTNFAMLDCVPAYENDISNLLLCRPEEKDNADLQTLFNSGIKPICIRAVDIMYDLNEVYTRENSLVRKGAWNKDTGNKVSVAVKSLNKKGSDMSMEFLESVNKCLFWHNEDIVPTFGIILDPLALVMEYFPYGPFDVFLQNNGESIRTVDLVESAVHLARALWYLEGIGMIHGNIRCHNVLLDIKTDNACLVKLGDPGIPTPSLSQIHWIPVECYKNFPSAKNSLPADIWAFATTLWEIFSYGQTPTLDDTPLNKAMEVYLNGGTLSKPNTCKMNISDIYDMVMVECWNRDADLRMKPQTILRDINQIFHGEYQSRMNTHIYSTIIQEPSALIPYDIDGLHDPELTIESHRLELDRNKELGRGNYGKVYRGTLKTASGLQTVAVKQLNLNELGLSNAKELTHEINIMKLLVHPKIVQIIGIVEDPERMLVMEYLSLGSLLSYLRSHKQQLSQNTLLKYAMDVAEGMDYLGRKGVVHRDLAARNVLVESENSVKISDFGLAQNMGPKGYYRRQTLRQVPIRWYALESLRFEIYTKKSDVWSFGVTLWEMFTYGEYPTIEGCETNDDKEWLRTLESEKRLMCPEKCTQRIYAELMTPCWAAVDTDRPDFQTLIFTMRDMYE